MNRIFYINESDLKKIKDKGIRINERHVIKLPKSEPPLPPIQNEPLMDEPNNEPSMPNDEFNADGNEQNDPKKEIQQLTGKLSQLIRQYNKDEINPDTELSQYVLGMIISAAKNTLTQDQKEKLSKKLVNPDDTNDENDDLSNEDGFNDGQSQNEVFPQNESIKSSLNIINEIIGNLRDSQKEKIRKEKRLSKQYQNNNFNPYRINFKNEIQ